MSLALLVVGAVPAQGDGQVPRLANVAGHQVAGRIAQSHQILR